MKIVLKTISGVILIGGFIGLLAYGLNYLQKPGPLENIEKMNKWRLSNVIMDLS